MPSPSPLQGFLLAGAQDDAGKGMVIHAAKIRFFRVKSEKVPIFFVISQIDSG